MKNNVTIRIGAEHYDAQVRNGDEVVSFDLSKMNKHQLRIWRTALVKAFREAA